MSTRSAYPPPAAGVRVHAGEGAREAAAAGGGASRGGRAGVAGSAGDGARDPAELVALVARARRETLLRVHRRRLRPEDLEDCYGQAVLELLAAARRGRRFASRLHLARVLEQRFLSRVVDRRRALDGRSPQQAALAGALSLGGLGERTLELADPRAEVAPLVAHRAQLRAVVRLAPRLTADQRLVLASQVALGQGCAEFCEVHGWTHAKYRKVSWRARARLRALLEESWGEACGAVRPVPATDGELGAADGEARHACGVTRAASRSPGASRRPVSHSLAGVGREP